MGDFYIDKFIDEAVRSREEDLKMYRYPGENYTLEFCGSNQVSMTELRSNRFLVVVSEATKDIKCEALDYIYTL